jgi:7-carboxy-7-deazaguanine synthase
MKTINLQPIEKREVSNGSHVEVHSIFYTIQGEGPFTGRPAIFIRLAGCNLKCPSCDTDYTSKRSKMNINSIRLRVIELSPNDSFKPLIVITGGEPFRQNIKLLCRELYLDGHEVQIETNGTLAPEDPEDQVWSFIHIVCSPKAGKVHPWIEKYASCFKYVLSHDSVDFEDGLPVLALNHTASPRVHRPSRKLPIYLQPMDSQDESENRLNVEAVKKSCMMFGYLFQIQMHKVIGVE